MCRIRNLINLPRLLLAQLVRAPHRCLRGQASYSGQPELFFSFMLSLRTCISCVFNCDDRLHDIWNSDIHLFHFHLPTPPPPPYRVYYPIRVKTYVRSTMTILREQLIPNSNAHNPRTSDRYDMQRDPHVSCYLKTYKIELFILKGIQKG